MLCTIPDVKGGRTHQESRHLLPLQKNRLAAAYILDKHSANGPQFILLFRNSRLAFWFLGNHALLDQDFNILFEF
jgi:hypothetical protein